MKHHILSILLFILSVIPLQAQITIGGNVYGGGNAGDVGGNTTVTVRSGDLNAVFGGARMANVGGRALVNIDGEHASDYVLANFVYGGNDISGTIGTFSTLPTDTLTQTTENQIDNTWNAFVHISAKTETVGTGDEATIQPASDAKAVYIGQLFGGGNGDYVYPTTPNSDGLYEVKTSAGTVVATSTTAFHKPELNKTYLEVLGGSIIYAFGGGNNATVNGKTVICVDNPSNVVSKILVDGVDQITKDNRVVSKMKLNPGYTYPNSDAFQIGCLFGGNNTAPMAIQPTWKLKSGKIRNVYSGGNQGNMTNTEGLLLEIAADSKIVIDNLYGGCRKADVHPAVPDADMYKVQLSDAQYKFPAGLAARVLVRGGDVNNVYGGNDISGRVYGGNAVGVYARVRGDVYGGGNGSYPYTDKAELKNDPTYADLYYEVPAGKTSVEALNDFRPNAEQVSIRLKGDSRTHPTIIDGSVYVGGNSATLKTNKQDPMVHLKIGSHVMVDNVFLGNNGANMVKTNDGDEDNGIKEGILKTMKEVSTVTLTDSITFANYMKGCEMDLMPAVVFDNTANGDPDDYEEYSTYIGSIFCGGNVGSMNVPGKTTINFQHEIIVFEKVVGGCNNANVPQSTYNALCEGGILGDADSEGNKLELNFNGLKIQPKRWAGEKDADGNYTSYAKNEDGHYYLEWNTISAATGDDVAPVTTGENVQSDASDSDRRLKGGNVYGGCYNSGHVNGNVVINLNASLVDRKGENAIFDEVDENEGEALLYAQADYKILKRHTGVILDKQGMDPLAKALNVFGGGFGADSEIWGSTTINLNAGYTFQIFGGGEKGAVGRGERNADGVLEYNTYDPKYSCTVNLKGNSAGTYRGDVDNSDNAVDKSDMAEAEFIYGGSFLAPIAGNTRVNLGNGRIFNSFAGSCNADILGHAETYVGRNTDNDADLGFPWVRDHIYGGNDLGGRILNKDSAHFKHRLDESVQAMVYNPQKKAVPDVLRASAYVEYIQGRIDRIFGGCYGDYDYSDSHYSDYTYYAGETGLPTGKTAGMPRVGSPFTKPRMESAFVNFRPNSQSRNTVSRVYGAGQGHTGDSDRDVMQDRSYVLINIPEGIKRYQTLEVFGAGDYSGVGMGIDANTAKANTTGVTAAAVVDLIDGQINAVYGASYNEGITRRTVVNVPRDSRIRVHNIFGGAYGITNRKPCDVFEATVNFKGKEAYAKNIYGGNNAYRRTLYGKVNVSVPVWQTEKEGYMATVYGAGYGQYTWSQYTEVHLTDSAKVYEVYGGGNAGRVLNKESVVKYAADSTYNISLSSAYATYTDNYLNDPLVLTNPLGNKTNTNVFINKGANVVNYCYGGGYGATAIVSGTTYIGLHGGYVKKDLYAGGWGGGVLDLYKAKNFTATANAYIEGGKVRNVYGGCYEGHVGYHDQTTTASTNDIPAVANVVIGIRKDQDPSLLPADYGFYNGIPTVERNAYAGGEGGAVYGTANIILNNGYIGYRYFAKESELEDNTISYFNTPYGCYQDKLHDETWTDGVGANRLADCGSVYGGGYDDNSSVDISNVTVWGGIVRNSVYGGGELATIGRGATEESGVDNVVRTLKAIYMPGQTHVTMYNGRVLHNVFGGGKGFNKHEYGRKHQFYTDGYVFGRTDVAIHGGEVGTTEGLAVNTEDGGGYGNVFGGGNIGYVYSPSFESTKTKQNESTGSPNHIYYYDAEGKLSEDCRVVVAPMLQVRPGKSVSFGGKTYGPYQYVPTDYLNTLKAKDKDTRWKDLFCGDGTAESDPEDMEERGVHIYNAVFAGGNVSSNNESYANATTVYGNATATLYDVYHRDFITVGTEHVGGLYGGGNLSVVGGYRELNITNYGTDYYGLDQQISLTAYRDSLTNRERAYFRLEYLCMQDVTINGKNYKKEDRISEEDYDNLPVEYKSETYWVQYGFCSIYAGRLLNTIQRADFCGVYGSRMVLQGAKDRVADIGSNMVYTINRVSELSLNQQLSHAGDTEEKSRVHGNYFGIYSVVNYLGNLTSDVRFTDMRQAVVNGQTVETDKSYYNWKVDNLQKRDRNNGTCLNQVALASGVFLELTTEKSTPSKKDYGLITGIIELDLINVKKDIEGGGYVYAKNEHGKRSEVSHINKLLSPYNMASGELRDEARTYKFYTYSESSADQLALETSGNFIHRKKRIVDDCYPHNGVYNDDDVSPAHYWYIKGEVYIYDQVVSAYTGTASSYSKEVRIPLTITAGAQGRLKLLNVQPNLYAYYSDISRTTKIGADGVKVDNESMTYHLNDVITWWDWHQLADNEKKYFVKETYVNVDTCYIDNRLYPEGTYVLENDSTVHNGDASKTAYKLFDLSAHTFLDKKKQPMTAEEVATLFRSSNNISHNNGYVLTMDMNSPNDWDDWYSPVTGASTSSSRKKKEDYLSLTSTQRENYREGPTYTLKEDQNAALYGQRWYSVGEILSKEVYDDYTSTVSKMESAPADQASVESAYVALATVGGAQAGSAISVTEYAALTDKSNYDKALVCVNSIQLGEESYILNGELVGQSTLSSLAARYKAFNNAKQNVDPVDDEGALAYIKSNLSDAFYCTEEGYYGGQFFQNGINYNALKTWCALPGDRSKFAFNGDAFDVLLDPTYPGEGHTSIYGSPYCDVKPVDYKAAYTGGVNGTSTLTYVNSAGTSVTLNKNSDPISREEYENCIANEQRHYTRLVVKEGGQTVYIATESFVNSGTPYAKGQDITQKDYNSLSTANKSLVRDTTIANTSTDEITVYYCYDEYTPTTVVSPISGTLGKVGSILSETNFLTLKNYQRDFTIQGMEPTETTTLYVSSESNAKDVTSEKVISVVYQYTYYEDDQEGEGVSLTNELHVINIHLQLESGVPEIGKLSNPPAVLPGKLVDLKAPAVNPGLYEVLTNGWEIYTNSDDADNHRNGVPFVNNGTKLYWYQNQKVWVAFYSKTYLGKTYSNSVPLTVANYHDLREVMADTEHHLYVDYDPALLDRNCKIYINNYAGTGQNGLDEFSDFVNLSYGSGPAGHAPLSNHVTGGQNLEFYLRTDIAHPAAWTPIASGTGQCFGGNLHGDGHTLSGLDHSVFGHLCGSVYNLGVTGSFTSAGVADLGDGYAENCWVSTSGAPATGVKAVFGQPDDDGHTHVVNSYYPDLNAYAAGEAKAMSERDFYNGTVAYNLNGFYLNRRYYDGIGLSEGTAYNCLTALSNGQLADLMTTVYYPSEATVMARYGDLGYVERRFMDGDFVYAAGSIPDGVNIRQRMVTTGEGEGAVATACFAPIWPDDYLYFGQMLTYGHSTQAHDCRPSCLVKNADRLTVSNQSNRVMRAPAYYRSNVKDVVHFNPSAYLVARSAPKSITDTDLTPAYPNMTAVDFAGHNDANYRQGYNGRLFYEPLLDDGGLVDIDVNGQTPNMLVYAPAAAKNERTGSVLASCFTGLDYSDYADTGSSALFADGREYGRVASAAGKQGTIHGLLVLSTLRAASDHLLTDKQDFNCPIAYSMGDHRMWYQRTPDNYVDITRGWESISLPFTVDVVAAADKGELTHFYDGSTTGHEYWLRQFDAVKASPADASVSIADFNCPAAGGADKTVENTFLWDYYYEAAGGHSRHDKNGDTYQTYYSEPSREYAAYPRLAATVPYLIGFPGPGYYEFDLSGRFAASTTASPNPEKLERQVLTFASLPGVNIGVSDTESAGVSHSGYYFHPNYLNVDLPAGTYMMTSDGSAYGLLTAADTAAKTNTVSAFRTYFSTTADVQKAPRQIMFNRTSSAQGSDDPMQDDLHGGLLCTIRNRAIIVTSSLLGETDVRIVNVNGQPIAAFGIQPGESIETPVNTSGVYIIRAAGGRYIKKVIVK